MSIPQSEEGAKLRANAAYLIIQKELDFKEIERQFKNYKRIEPNSPSKLYDKEFKVLISITKSTAESFQHINSIVYMTCSAISASSFPINSSAKVTLMITSMDNARIYLKEIEKSISEFKRAARQDQEKDIILFIQNTLGKLLTEIRNTINVLYQLLFT